MLKDVIAAILIITWASTAHGETIASRASVIDGDTIEIHDERIRILDIDAPESRQTCQDQDGAEWRCGQKAAAALSDWIGMHTVTCDTTEKDMYKRWLARCAIGRDDMAEWVAAQGWAVPYRDCKCEEIRALSKQAELRNAGMWGGEFQMPWDWRKIN